MYFSDVKLGKNFQQMLVAQFQVFQVALLVFLNQRENEIDLAPGLYLVAYAVVKPGMVFGIIVERFHRLAPGRKLVDNGDVQVAIDRHGQGAGYRRGCHHKHVGSYCVFRPKAGTLAHAEAVLLVDDGQA